MMLWTAILALGLTDREADHICCHNYRGVNQAQELQHLWCQSSKRRNILKEVFVK